MAGPTEGPALSHSPHPKAWPAWLQLPGAAGALPVAAVLGPLAAALDESGVAVLSAPPGAGKTTAVPLALLRAPWLAGQRIVMLEPRRLAARQAAARMADLLGEPIGATVGYAMRFERRVGPATRIEVVTEGLLARRLVQDPDLEGVGLVIFDEFHERSLDADLALALCREIREALRSDLRLLVMSATLDESEVARFLGDAPVIRSDGRMHPVETRHVAGDPAARLEDRMVAAIRQALVETPGSVLAFLPGAAEIRRTAERLAGRLDPARFVVAPLYGDLGRAQQDAALRPAPKGLRKIVLATSIAETSLTIEGIGTVVDSGLARRQRFSARTGMSRLVTEPASRAEAGQRRGRAGRLGPGFCYRLWSEAEDRARAPQRSPEIEAADLAPLALDLAIWGVAEPGALAWLTPPPAGAFAQGRSLLVDLGALDAAGRVTSHGRRMAALPVHPRLAHMLIMAVEGGFAPTAIAVTALLGGRDPFRRQEADMATRLPELAAVPSGHELQRLRQQLARLLGVELAAEDPAHLGKAVALAFPDRVARRRGAAGSFLLVGGRGAAMDPAEPLAEAEWLAIAGLDDVGAAARIRLAARLEAGEVEALFADRLATSDEIAWDRRIQAVRAERVTRLGALALRSTEIGDAEPAAIAAALMSGVATAGVGALAWPEAAASLRSRLAFLKRHEPEAWPGFEDSDLLGSLEERIAFERPVPRRPADIPPWLLLDLLAGALDHGQRQRLDAEAPTHVGVPSGSRLPIDYGEDPPVLRVRLQELFGLSQTPAIRGGRTPLTLHLLSPARRPVQVTQDLAGFWARGWPEVRKELRGRYPRHSWPEDPTKATATARARPR